ncbi:glycosyltransferase [Rhizobium sp. Root482]|uniref:glycosyltransferase n=1 Tax=Rhizobium sp. Root482 TaxID=1736543 RepID=UPI0006F3E92B|nr:glycosyltransferase [Rhizobium sp. Root482]KQY26676.1 hypothetical protein ASD31_00225 [Rhizobium sp. Root482]
MKIVHVIHSIDAEGGGLQAVAMRLAAAQSLMGHDIHLVGYGDSNAKGRMFEAARAIPGFDGVYLHIMARTDSMELVLCLDGRTVLNDVLRHTDMVHLHGVWEPMLKLAASLARRAKIPYCICPAGMLDLWSLQQKAWKKRTALKLGYRKMLDEAHFIHALNADEVDLMAPLALKAPKHIIPNGVFAEEFAPLPQQGLFRRDIEFADDRRFVLFLSRLHYKKGLDILAKAFRIVADACPDVDLVVAGPDGGSLAGFTALVRDLRLSDRVRIVGPIYGPAKLQAIVDAACFCLPSRQEGFSIAITEALACGTPAVITHNCHFPEVATADAGLVVALDPTEVADALIAILGDVAMTRRMGKNGRALVLENYTWPKIAAMTLNAYCAEAAVDG